MSTTPSTTHKNRLSKKAEPLSTSGEESETDTSGEETDNEKEGDNGRPESQPRLVTVEVTCTGISPLLMNPFQKEVGEAIRTQIKLPQKTDQTHEEEAAKKLCLDENRRIVIPVDNIYACLLNAGASDAIVGKKNKLTVKSGGSLIPSRIIFHGQHVLLTNGNGGEPQWVADTRRTVNPQTGGANFTTRPCFVKWGFTVIITIRTDRITEKIVRRLFDVAGEEIGLGDWRPAKKGRYGMFLVTGWKIVESKTI